MSTNFDPAAFLDMPVDEANVKRPPVMIGDYTATVKDVTAEAWQSKTKVDETTGQLRAGLKYSVKLTLEIPEAERTRIGLTQTSIELGDSIMLELNASGGIDTAPGKNGSLRRYRDALDMNKPGQPFKARDMIGRLLLVKIAHREYPEGSGDLVEEIKGVARIGG